MKINKNIAVSESGFIFNPSRGDAFSTNTIGSEIVNMLKEERSEEEIKQYLLDTYETDEVTLEKDFYDFMKMLKQYNLLEA